MKKLLFHLGHVNRAAIRAANEGRFGDAMFQLHLAQLLARDLDSPLQVARVENNLGMVLLLQDKTDEALGHLRKAVDIAREFRGDEHPFVQRLTRQLDELCGRSEREERLGAVVNG